MRKTIGVLIVVPLLLAALFYYSDSYTKETSDALISAAHGVADEIRVEDWQAALHAVDGVSAMWENTRKTLQIWINHPDADGVTIAVALLRTSIVENERFHALAYVDELLESLGHLYHRDNFALTNIL